MKDELNYKEAYYYLFNKITDNINSLKNIQNRAEKICTNENICQEVPKDIDQTLKNITEYIKEIKK